MDAIRKKMQSLKSETDGLYATIRGFEDAAKEATGRADQVNQIVVKFQTNLLVLLFLLFYFN